MKKRTIFTLIITMALILSNLSFVFADDGVDTAPDTENEPAAAEQTAKQPAPQQPEQAEQTQEAAQEPAGETTPAEESADSKPAAEETEEQVAADETSQETASQEPGESDETEQAAQEPVEDETTPTEESADGEPVEEEPEAAVESETAVEPETEGESEAAKEEDAEAGAPKDAQADGGQAETEEPTAASEQDLSDVVAVLNDADAEVLSDDGTPLPLASQEAADVLASTDPFFFDTTINKWVGYAQDITTCPANVICNPSAAPFQDAVTAAGIAAAGNDITIYVASGDYAEDVDINYANQSLVAFHDVTVPDASLPTITIDSSGYAVVRSITLNVDLAANDGVYADKVIVNEPGSGKTGGRLDDAMELVNDGGRIEADVQIYSVSNGANQPNRVRDYNHHEVNFEWECGEPNEVIYLNKKYRMTLMNPLDQDIIDYYHTHGDERPSFNLLSEERIKDLQIAVNVSEEPGGTVKWDHDDEERIYWYLLGNVGFDTHGNDITLDNINTDGNGRTQQDWADEITDGDWDDITRYWNIWFMYPEKENNKKVSASDRQLTFFVYDPRPVFGCTDDDALNWDPNADTDDESCVYNEGCTDPAALNYDPDAVMDDGTCSYPADTDTPPAPAFVPAPLPIPVTGEEEILIPVTGVDAQGSSSALFEIITAVVSLLIVSISLIIVEKKKQLEA